MNNQENSDLKKERSEGTGTGFNGVDLKEQDDDAHQMRHVTR